MKTWRKESVNLFAASLMSSKRIKGRFMIVIDSLFKKKKSC